MSKASNTLGIILITFAILGIILLSKRRRNFMFALFQLTTFFSMAILLAMGLVVLDVGKQGHELVDSYCTGSFDIWFDKDLGKFITLLDKSYIDIESNNLCSS